MKMPQKPKVMILVPDLPYPVTSGGRRRMASLIRGMADFATVHMACITQENPAVCSPWLANTGCSLACYRRPPPGPMQLWFQRLIMIFQNSNLFYRPDERRFIDQQILEFQPDVVWVETSYLLQSAIEWPARVPVIVDYWGTSEGPRRDYANAHGFRKIWEWLRWRTARGGEKKYAPCIHDIVTVSKLDGEYFRAISPHSRIWPIPVSIDLPDPALIVPEDPQALIMTGDLSYRPNVDAAQYFIKEIFPLIRLKQPMAHVRFIGRNPSPAVQALQAVAGVEVRGFMPHLAVAIAEAAIYILPMRLGSGIPTKLFDVFPVGKPIVSTSIGVEGLELTHRENCLVADTPRDFADACCALFASETERRRLGANARTMARQLYAHENIAQLIKETVTTAIVSFDKAAGAKR